MDITELIFLFVLGELRAPSSRPLRLDVSNFLHLKFDHKIRESFLSIRAVSANRFKRKALLETNSALRTHVVFRRQSLTLRSLL